MQSRNSGGVWAMALALFAAGNAPLCSGTLAFVPPKARYPGVRELRMGRGFNSAKNRQAELARKMELAKKQQNKPAERELSEEERKLKEDHARFARLLRESQVQNDVSAAQRISTASTAHTTPKSTSPNEVKAKALKRRKEVSTKDNEDAKNESDGVPLPLQEGDIARRQDFELLISVETSRPLGPIDAAKLVPWVPPFVSDYLVILTDPRTQSGDLRQTIKYLTSNLAPEILEQVIVVNADPVVETKSWIRRAEVETPIKFFSDQNWEWMRSYSAVVNDGRWSMSIMVICNDGRIRKILRDVDPPRASQLVTDMVESIE